VSRNVHVCRAAGQQDSSGAVRRRLPGVPAGEVDACRFPDRAAPTVTTDDVPRPDSLVSRERDSDTGRFVGDARHLASPMDRHTQLVDPVGEDALDVVLPQRQPVWMPGRKVTDVQTNLAEPADLGGITRGEEAVGDSALVEDLDGAGVQASRTRADETAVGPAFDDRDVHPRQCQLSGQGQAGRTPADDYHVMLGKLTHPHPPIAEKLVRPAILRQRGGLAASPPVRIC